MPLTLTTTINAELGHNTSANPAYNKTNFAPNFTGTTWITQSGTTLAVDSNKSDDSFNPITPCHISAVSVKTLTPAYTGKRVILVVPYDFGGTVTPHLNIGVNTNTTAWASSSMNSLKARGYDGITIDWYGPARYEDTVSLLLKSQIESMTGFTFAIMIDTSGGSYSTTASLESYLAYLQTNYFSSPAYRKWAGKPIVYMWGSSVPGVDYAAAKASIGTSMYWIGQGPGQLSNSWMDGIFDWVQPYLNGVNLSDPYNSAAKISFINSARSSSKGSVLSIAPGFNGYETKSVGWSKGKYMPRDNGKCWLSQSALVNSNVLSNAVEIQDTTFNDWEEATELEDAIDNGITVTASITGSTLSWSVSGGTGDETTIHNYMIMASPDGTNAAYIGTQATGGSKTFNLATVGSLDSTHQIYVVAEGAASIRRQWSAPISYTPTSNTTTTLVASPNPAPFGSSVLLTATVSPTPTGVSLGAVTFFSGTTNLGTGTVNTSGVATLLTTALHVGANSLTAQYSGVLGYNASTSSPFSETITTLSTTTALVSSMNPAPSGAAVILTATVSPAPTGSSLGTVSFFTGATLLGSSNVVGATAVFSTTSLPVGVDVLTAVYNGTTGYSASTSSAVNETILVPSSAAYQVFTELLANSNGLLYQQLTPAISQTTATVADANKIVVTDSLGLLDPSFIPLAQGSVTSVSGTTVSVIFPKNYVAPPTVMVTPRSNAGSFYVSTLSNTGFTVTYANSGVQTFAYVVFGKPN